MPFNALSTFQINTRPFVKYDLKLLEPTTNEIYTLTTRYRIYKFNQNGTITLGLDRLLTTDSLTNKLNYCVVGGGGGGSGAVKAGTVNGVDKYAYGSGGGGGQVKTGFVQICSSDNNDKQETVIITIGEGGAGTAKNTGAFYPKNTASTGSPSSISFSGYKSNSTGSITTVFRDTITALGGAGGKTLLAGASGGGTSGGISNLNGKGGGGGGGSDLNKGEYGSINAGNGGIGTYNSVFNRCVGGGGGGGLSDYHSTTGTAGIGGTGNGGGGNGGSTTEIAQPGYANYGGGGGGGGGGYLGNYDGAAGGSGVVFIWISY